MAKEEKKEVKCEIINQLGVISETNRGWRKEFNRISWDGREPVYDIRKWSPDHEKRSRGIALSETELRKLAKMLADEVEFLDQEALAAVSSPTDEIKKYKELLDIGAISQEEFNAKKKQLLGL